MKTSTQSNVSKLSNRTLRRWMGEFAAWVSDPNMPDRTIVAKLKEKLCPISPAKSPAAKAAPTQTSNTFFNRRDQFKFFAQNALCPVTLCRKLSTLAQSTIPEHEAKNKIIAIRLVRDELKNGLAEAKQFVDFYWDKWKTLPKPSPTSLKEDLSFLKQRGALFSASKKK